MEAFDQYLSLAAPSQGLFKDKGSRFIALAYPVETEQEVKAILSSLRKEYHDARHHCYAFRLGYKADVFRSSDDGEPSGTAGRPILGQLESAGLSDVLVVVVRYFGGIKLGVPGLIRAYKSATADALAQAQVITKTATRRFRLRFGYLSMNAVMKLLKEMDLPQAQQDFGETCSLLTQVPLSQANAFLENLQKHAEWEEL